MQLFLTLYSSAFEFIFLHDIFPISSVMNQPLAK